MKQKLIKQILASLSLITAISCTGGGGDSSGNDQKTSAPFALIKDPSRYQVLRQFESCDALATKVRDHKMQRLSDSLARQRHYLEQTLARVEDQAPNDLSTPEADGGDASTDESSKAPEDVSETNTQVQGVDEADIIKTTGTHIYALSKKGLKIVKSWPANEMAELASIPVNGRAIDLILEGTDKLILSYIPPREQQSQYSFSEAVEPGYYPYNDSFLILAIYDVSNPASPILQKELRLAGNYNSLRRVGSSLFVVQNFYGDINLGLNSWVDTWSEGRYLSLEEFDQKAEELSAEHAELLGQKTVAELLRHDVESDDVLVKSENGCAKVFTADEADSYGITKVSAINLDDFSMTQSAVLAGSSTVYATAKSLYVADRSFWRWSDTNNWGPRTFFHKFDISTANQLNYMASGSVSGYLKDQFAMDDQDDILRLAVTDQIPLEEDSQEDNRWWFDSTTVNRVVTVAQKEASFEVLGQTEDLAKGERIYSARFQGDKAFVVTFRQVDPLYTIDLSDARNPKVVGELKIPGFSTYMQMLDENHLLAVGRDGDEEGRLFGVKLSIYDVTDFANPKEKHKHVINDFRWNSSESEYNHKAFNYFAARKMLSIPIGGYGESSDSPRGYRYFSELKVFDIDTESGISPRGTINMEGLESSESSENSDGWYGWWSYNQARRTVFADDYIYGYSEAGIRVVHNSDLETTVSEVSFP